MIGEMKRTQQADQLKEIASDTVEATSDPAHEKKPGWVSIGELAASLVASAVLTQAQKGGGHGDDN
jgi:hypothetical protein